MKKREYKVLNFTDAMHLAEILIRYIDIDKLNKDQTVLEFIESIVKVISSRDYLECINLFLGEKILEKSIPSGDELVSVLFNGMKTNNIFLLIRTYKSLGFV